jgi:hypothetical protein
MDTLTLLHPYAGLKDAQKVVDVSGPQHCLAPSMAAPRRLAALRLAAECAWGGLGMHASTVVIQAASPGDGCLQGVYYGGIAAGCDMVRAGLARQDEFKLLLGVAGWAPGMLIGHGGGGGGGWLRACSRLVAVPRSCKRLAHQRTSCLAGPLHGSLLCWALAACRSTGC